MRKYLFLILLVLLSTFVSSSYFQSDEAEIIFTSEELEISQEIVNTVHISNVKKPLSWVSATLNYYPKETYRQSIISETHKPEYETILAFGALDLDPFFGQIGEVDIVTGLAIRAGYFHNAIKIK